MDQPSSPDATSPADPPEGRLDSWKEIAAYLKRDVTTVQRWEKRERMPVHRHLHDKIGSVYAFRSELDTWARGRNLQPAEAPDSADAAAPDAVAQAPRPSPQRPASRWPIAAVGLALTLGLAAWYYVDSRDVFWRSPLANATFQNLTDFGGNEQAAAISRDGRFVAFLSDRDGATDVWLTQIGTGEFHNLTHGRSPAGTNPQLRAVDFTPDGAFVLFWTRRDSPGSKTGDIAIWMVPTLGGEPRPYLEGAAEANWSSDGTALVYHTPAKGDPTFVRGADPQSPARQIFAADAGSHAHFTSWSPDGRAIYIVEGTLPEPMDLWRIGPSGGTPERVTSHNSQVAYPVFLDAQTLLYLATDRDGSGSGIYSLDVSRRIPHRVSTGVDRYTSLSASADGRKLVVTQGNPTISLWRLTLGDLPAASASATPISLTTGAGVAPRLGPGYLVYASSKGASDSVWKVTGDAAIEVWSEADARIIGGPEISPDGRQIAFSADRGGKTRLYVVNADGTGARAVTDTLALRGGPAWAPDGQSIASAAIVDRTPRLFRIALNGTATALGSDYALDPVWAPDGDFLLYSGADVGTTFPINGVDAIGKPHAVTALTLTRGARRLRFVQGRHALVIMRGGIEHKDLFLLDLDTGVERQLTALAPDFNIRDFDISADGRQVVLERVQEHSDVVLIDRGGR